MPLGPGVTRFPSSGKAPSPRERSAPAVRTPPPGPCRRSSTAEPARPRPGTPPRPWPPPRPPPVPPAGPGSRPG
ncbi:MAG: hypothetical protein D6708_15900 [Candidatus Dadabacteria bacterium]|nr:MAG: hypothetical protein D6708_15900 [Candidatus Dadabacteria bacterium]